MRILAIDSGGLALGVAALETGSTDMGSTAEILRVLERDTAIRHTEALPGAVAELLAELQWPVASLQGVITGAGPGSFTGLRVGMAAAKGISLATGCPLVSVDTLEAIVASILQDGSVSDVPDLVVPLIDARKGRFYTALFTVSSAGLLHRLTENMDIQPEILAVKISSESPLRPGVQLAGVRLGGRVDPALLPEHLRSHHLPGAATAVRGIARLGTNLLRAGVVDDPWKGPNYLRSGDVGTPRVYPRFNDQDSPAPGSP